MNYWDKKKQLSEAAKKQAKFNAIFYKDAISECVEASEVHSAPIYSIPHQDAPCEIIIEELDSVAAIQKYVDYKNQTQVACVLNFASYKEPGGRFLDGSSAQEESLCHSSVLYNVLSVFGDFYAYNKAHLNKALYTNRAIYSPRVLFPIGGIMYHVDVLTCAAPNKKAAQEYCHVSDADNLRALQDRLDFILSIAAAKTPDVLILGAYGCGVFGQNPNEVATLFAKLLHGKYASAFKKVVFAIPEATGENFKAFARVF